MSDTQVIVLYDLDYCVNGHMVTIRKDERLQLKSRYSNEWWQVERLPEVVDIASAQDQCEEEASDVFFVPKTYVKVQNNSEFEEEEENDHDYDLISDTCDKDDFDTEKRSDEAIGSSRDSLIELDNDGDNCDIRTNCDQLVGKIPIEDRLEGIYVEPFAIVKPRKAKPPPPLYANVESSFEQTPPPLVTDSSVKMKRILFENWAEYVDVNNRPFYYNTLNHQSSWKPPRRTTVNVSSGGASSETGSSTPPPQPSADEADEDGESTVVLSENVRKIVEKFNAECLLAPNLKFKRFHNSISVTNSQSTRDNDDTVVCVSRNNLCTPRIPKLYHICPPKGWLRYFDTQTKEVYFVNKCNNVKWFCKKDENGKIFFYDENRQNYCSELPVLNDEDDDEGGGGQEMGAQSTNGEQNTANGSNMGQNNRSNNDPKNRLSNFQRSLKTQSVTMGQPGNNDIQFLEEFKHSSPFKNLQIKIPPPPSSLDMTEIIYYGTLNRTKTLISGKAKRKHWATSYVVLTQYYLLFFKDKKTAFLQTGAKTEFVIGLLNATIEWCQTESSRKNCFKVSTFQDQVLLQGEDAERSSLWFAKINTCIKNLPSVFNLPCNLDSSGKLKRSRSSKQYRPNEEYKIQGSATLSGYATISNTPIVSDKRGKIRERLRQFLRKRPTIESLREKGIIRDENVFGCNLDRLCEVEKQLIPKFVQLCVQSIEFKDLTADGIYRACGNLSNVQKLRFEINQDRYQGLWKEDDVHVLTGLLKMFFRDMKEPLFPCDRFESLMKFIAIQNKETKLNSFRTLVRGLPDPNYQTLKFILAHLLRVTEQSQENRMHVQNLAIVFGPTLIRPMNDLNNLFLDMMIQMQQSQVIEFLLQNYGQIFE